MERVIGLEAFDREVLQADMTTIVVFESSWCPFCNSFRPLIEEAEDALHWRVLAVSLDDLDDPLWDSCAVDVVPSMAVFERGKVIFRINGVLGKGLSKTDIERLKDFCSNRPKPM